MCLITKEKVPTISSYNIICYKILIPEGGKFITPFRDFLFPIGEEITDKIDKQPSEVFGQFVVEGGYFHSYKNIDSAKKKVSEIKRKLSKKDIKIFEAEIPEGTPFFEGQFEDLCSKVLKITKEYED